MRARIRKWGNRADVEERNLHGEVSTGRAVKKGDR